MLLLERNNRVLTDCYKPHYLVRQLLTYLHNSMKRNAQLVEKWHNDLLLPGYSSLLNQLIGFPKWQYSIASIHGLLFLKHDFFYLNFLCKYVCFWTISQSCFPSRYRGVRGDDVGICNNFPLDSEPSQSLVKPSPTTQVSLSSLNRESRKTELSIQEFSVITHIDKESKKRARAIRN